MLTSYLPYPPSSGGQVRSYNLIKNLAKKHQISLFALIKDEAERKHVKELEKFCHKVRIFKRPEKPWTLVNILKTGLGPYPFLVVRNSSAEEKKALTEELAKETYDLIHAENFYVMPHIPKTKIPILLTEQTIFYQVYRHYVATLAWYLFFLKIVLIIDILKLKYWESYYWRRANYLAAVSEDDISYIKKVVPGRKVFIIPNGVDFEFYRQKKYPKNKQATLLFGAADFHWMQNTEGAKLLIEKVWPIIKEKNQAVKLWIVGKIAPDALVAYKDEERIIIQEIKDSREAYQRSWVLVAPMRSGGGSRTKFFEAMASGLPIVTTSEGVEGIKAKDKEEIFIENDLGLLAEKVLLLLEDKSLAEKVGQKARELVKKQYSWQKSAQALDKAYQEVASDQKN